MNTIIQTQEQQISAEALPVITWKQAKVITTELLARLYGTETDNIQKTFLVTLIGSSKANISSS